MEEPRSTAHRKEIYKNISYKAKKIIQRIPIAILINACNQPNKGGQNIQKQEQITVLWTRPPHNKASLFKVSIIAQKTEISYLFQEGCTRCVVCIVFEGIQSKDEAEQDKSFRTIGQNITWIVAFFTKGMLDRYLPPLPANSGWVKLIRLHAVWEGRYQTEEGKDKGCSKVYRYLDAQFIERHQSDGKPRPLYLNTVLLL